jgi:hypothetical protein
MDTALRPSCLGTGNNCGDLCGPGAIVRSGGSIRGFGFGFGGSCGDAVLTGRPSTPSACSLCGLPSILARGFGSSMFRCRSFDGGLTIPGDWVFSSGPFFTSRVASCSNRDFNELTDERAVSSMVALSMVAGLPDGMTQ